MPQTVRDVMTSNPVTVPADTPLSEVARLMRDRDIGTVIVVDSGGGLRGILTDRDLVVRGFAEGRDLGSTAAAELCSADLATLAPDDSVDRAIKLMRERAVRRLPVVENGRPVGIVSIGDLAMERDEESVLAGISAAPANR